ncbi:MAG TPA: CoA transferase, partial [Bryobacteraceae bacterium]|nr:CoA transferase [Bryobacteraceae bacterium]
QTGPHATHPGFGSQLSSLSGFCHLIGDREGPPHMLYGPYIDFIAVAYGGVAVLAALDRRRRNGEGCFIDLSQYEAGLQFIGGGLLDYSANGAIAGREGNRDPVAAPHGCFPCLDNQWCAISCWSGEEWERFCRAAGQEDWMSEARFATAAERREHEDALNRLIGAWTAGLASDWIMERLQRHGVHAAKVNTMRDLFSDPQVAFREVWQEREHSEMGRHHYRMVSYQLSETPGSVRGAAPCLGEHNEAAFLGWLKLSEEEYRDFEKQGAFG